ncbi:MAG: globin domain-containing protein [Pseudomonadota bacterium]
MDADFETLVTRSWGLALKDKSRLARRFYARLFAIAPETRDLFEEDLGAQGVKLVETFCFILDNIGDLDALLPAASALAIRHLDYDVEAEHYACVGDALITALRAQLGDAFDARSEEAWQTTYTVLSEHMIEAAYGARIS